MDQENKEKIISAAEGLFMKFGFRSVTMDDVARDVSMSKKTLYQYFENKDSLVTAVTEHYLKLEEEEYSSIADEAKDAIEELHGIANCMRNNMVKMNPSLLFDLKKFHANAWNRFLVFKDQFIKNHVKNNLLRGIDEGFYRSDIDAEILAVFRVEQVQMLFENTVFSNDKFDLAKVQLHLFEHFIYGILSHKGREEYEKYQDLIKQKIYQN